MRRPRLARLLCAMLCFLILTTVIACFPSGRDGNTEPSASQTSTEGTTPLPQAPQMPNEEKPLHRVAYIPIDNRPVNRERVAYLAESVGIELLMPKEEFYRTALDNMEPNADGSVMGNREALCAWLLETDKICDHFIISLDQLTSGGLVSSRWLSNTDLTFEYKTVDTILELCTTNTVYVFDTVMRLASTVGYQGYHLDEYNAFRAYGRVGRKALEGDSLTLQNIVSGYAYDQNGNHISTDLADVALAAYHASRERKLKITDYFLRSAADAVDFIYIGVDDSSPQNTIQTNEIRYIQSLMGERGVLSAATDELGLCCLSRMAAHFYGGAEVTLTYFGEGKDQPADEYDIGTLDESVQSHLSALLATQKEQDGDALEVLLLTYGSTNAHREALLQHLKQNQRGRLPTVIVDVSDAPERLAEMLMGDDEIDICQLLGYSSWNTAANAIGIALSQSTARYSYLQFVTVSTTRASAGFLGAMTFAYIKDISYKCFDNTIEGLLQSKSPCSLDGVLERINQGAVITSLKEPAATYSLEVSVSNFRYPWNRTFEMTFDIAVREESGK